MPEICIPFAGFYESKWSDALDSAEESDAEYFANDPCSCLYTEGVTEADHAEAMFHAVDYGEAHRAVAEDYVRYFAAAFPFAEGLAFKSLDSPRKYNFTTDRIVCTVPDATAVALYASALGAPDVFAEVLAERFAPCSGFIPYYRDDPAEWTGRDPLTLDAVELETCLVVCMRAAPDGYDPDWEWGVLERMDGNGCIAAALSGALDEDEYRARLARKQEETRS
jgi:hypothetical protein